jgi:hypothetical protein
VRETVRGGIHWGKCTTRAEDGTGVLSRLQARAANNTRAQIEVTFEIRAAASCSSTTRVTMHRTIAVGGTLWAGNRSTVGDIFSFGGDNTRARSHDFGAFKKALGVRDLGKMEGFGVRWEFPQLGIHERNPILASCAIKGSHYFATFWGCGFLGGYRFCGYQSSRGKPQQHA